MNDEPQGPNGTVEPAPSATPGPATTNTAKATAHVEAIVNIKWPAKLRNIVVRWVKSLDGPSDKCYEHANFTGNWGSLFIQLAFVSLLFTIFLAGKALVLTPTALLSKLGEQTIPTLQLVAFGAIAASCYAFLVAPVFKVKVSFLQALYCFLDLYLAWMPISALVPVGEGGGGFVRLMTVVFYLVTFVFPSRGMGRGIAKLSGAKPWVVYISLACVLAIAAAVMFAPMLFG